MIYTRFKENRFYDLYSVQREPVLWSILGPKRTGSMIYTRSKENRFYDLYSVQREPVLWSILGSKRTGSMIYTRSKENRFYDLYSVQREPVLWSILGPKRTGSMIYSRSKENRFYDLLALASQAAPVCAVDKTPRLRLVQQHLFNPVSNNWTPSTTIGLQIPIWSSHGRLPGALTGGRAGTTSICH